jgi:hypothetical protein
MTSQLCAIACVLLSLGLLAQEEAESRGSARELVRQLNERHSDAMAASDPVVPGRFIAALYIAPSQLLVVGAKHASTEAVAYKLREHQYRDVYLDLQASPAAEGKWFVHDLGADGLSRAANSSIDNVYEGGKRLALVDGGNVKRELFTRSDAEYSRMLRVLLDALSASPVASQETHAPITSN